MNSMQLGAKSIDFAP